MSVAEKFSEDLMKISVAKVCNRLGFDEIETDALELMISRIQKYIKDLAIKAKILAENDSRATVNFDDLLSGIKSLKPKIDQEQLEQITEKVVWDVSYFSGIPEYPVQDEEMKPVMMPSSSNSKVSNKFSVNKDGKDDKVDLEPKFVPYAPDFFPPFPDKHTYEPDVEQLEQMQIDADAAFKEFCAQKDAEKGSKTEYKMLLQSTLSKLADLK